MGPHQNKFPDNSLIRQQAKELRMLEQMPLVEFLKLHIPIPKRLVRTNAGHNPIRHRSPAH